MVKSIITCCMLCFIFCSCKEEKPDKSYGVLTHEDVVSIEENSTYSYESILYEGQFKGQYFDENITLDLVSNGHFIIQYKGKVVEGEWFKKDDGSLIEFESKRKLPFQFMRWSDNKTIMILNADGMADDQGQNYLTRIEQNEN